MFILEKIISLSLLSPLPIIILLIIFGFGNLFHRRVKSGFILILISIFLYLASTDFFVDKRLYSLESTYSPISEENLKNGEVYVLLGGGIITNTVDGNIPGMAPAVRIMKTAEYYKKFPKKIYISGGAPLQNEESESSVYARELVALGVNLNDIIIEEKSRNTNENALFIKEALKSSETKSIILVTSASHMRRSVNIFQKNLEGIEIFPAPCNFLASRVKENNFYYLPKYYNFIKFQSWLWETIGNLYYKMRY